MLSFSRTTKQHEIPMAILSLADEPEGISSYLHKSTIYTVKLNNQTIGAFCLVQLEKNLIEIKNIAIRDDFQNQGFGSQLLKFIIALAEKNKQELIVGTGDHSYRQQNFYQKNNFKPFSIRKNFFLTNYTQAIYENGEQLIDMIVFKYRP